MLFPPSIASKDMSEELHYISLAIGAKMGFFMKLRVTKFAAFGWIKPLR